MHINKIHVKNLLSYNDANFRFADYNVIVGSNNSGKTNLIRILDKIASNDNLKFFVLEKNLKFDKTKPSAIILSFEFTEKEIRLILQTMFSMEIPEIPENLRIINIVLMWNNITREKSPPDVILFEFGELVLLLTERKGHIVVHNEIMRKDRITLEQLVSKIQKSNTNNYPKQFLEEHGIQGSQFGFDQNMIKDFCEGKSLTHHFYRNRAGYCQIPFQLEYKVENPSSFSEEVIDYLELPKTSNQSIEVPLLINRIFRKCYHNVSEIHPNLGDLTSKMVELRNVYDSRYKKFREAFYDITTGIDVKVSTMTPEGKPGNQEIISLTENNKRLSLQDSASGHFSLIHTLHSILERNDSVIVFDEPEVHFHPIMIKRLEAKFRELSDSNNQIIIISHSPSFINYKLLDSAQSYTLTSIIKKDNQSQVQSTPEKFIPKLKEHLFNSDMFFGVCSLIVEGPDDYFTMKAISDHFDQIFEKNNITLIHCWGVNNVHNVIEIHNAFKIPFVAMVDKEYLKDMTNVIKHSNDLENEFQQMGWEGIGKVKEDAYPFISELLKQEDGKSKLKRTTIWKAFTSVIEKAGGNIPHN